MFDISIITTVSVNLCLYFFRNLKIAVPIIVFLVILIICALVCFCYKQKRNNNEGKYNYYDDYLYFKCLMPTQRQSTYLFKSKRKKKPTHLYFLHNKDVISLNTMFNNCFGLTTWHMKVTLLFVIKSRKNQIESLMNCSETYSNR